MWAPRTVAALASAAAAVPLPPPPSFVRTAAAIPRAAFRLHTLCAAGTLRRGSPSAAVASSVTSRRPRTLLAHPTQLSSSCAPPRRAFAAPTTGGGLWGYPSLLTYTAWESARKKLARHTEITERLNTAEGMHHEELTKLSKEHHALSAVATLVAEIEGLRTELRELQILSRSKGEPEMASMAAEEIPGVIERCMASEESIVQYLLPDAEDDMRDAILEVRAGTGGEEAGLWAKEMFHMYESFALRRGWTFGTLEVSHGDAGGYKEASASITGANVFGLLKHEAGVHRVQRIPATEASGRLHTSAATVAIMPEAEEVDVEINEAKDLRIDVFRAGGAGGQHVNKTESAVRITHLPTGVTVQMQDERSQIANRIKAMKILRSRLYEAARQVEATRRALIRSEQVGGGDRSERIRTYNFRESRVTDHRINVNKFGMDKMLSGELLEEFIDELMQHDRRMQLQKLM